MTRNCDFKDRIKLVFIEEFTCIAITISLWFASLVMIELFFPFFKEEFPAMLVFEILFVVSHFFKDVIFKRQSIAEKTMKVRIIDEKTNQRPSAKKLIFRNIFFITYITLGIDLIFCFKRFDNRTLGDIVSKTRVVYCEEHPKSKEFNCE